MRECGLKLLQVDPNDERIRVTPRAGVWIETCSGCARWADGHPSLPVRECGLKPEQRHHRTRSFRSLPVRECGLKQLSQLSAVRHTVTPRAGVWIETRSAQVPAHDRHVTPRAGVWIETLKDRHHHRQGSSLPVRECGLKLLIPVYAALECGHSPCGSVD